MAGCVQVAWRTWYQLEVGIRHLPFECRREHWMHNPVLQTVRCMITPFRSFSTLGKVACTACVRENLQFVNKWISAYPGICGLVDLSRTRKRQMPSRQRTGHDPLSMARRSAGGCSLAAHGCASTQDCAGRLILTDRTREPSRGQPQRLVAQSTLMGLRTLRSMSGC